MRLTVFAATLAFLLWGTPAFAGSAPDFDNDGVGDQIDNCSEDVNTAQDDSDGDDCGNICDANFDQTGQTGFNDFLIFSAAFGLTGVEVLCLVEDIPGCQVGFDDFLIFGQEFGLPPGPSGTTDGTTACP
jgi:hypothetical protein